ncbi:uncharacterized protein LOC126994164 [Eriocheir sinensis]|uniref:uncharacterized protein LOC126994164 n=1 Tax=Eriocheir sinensis TaxID=95602 RepID=UPI0021C85E74|nr:uncharacterized protein LOC126994164 [Eriocheir sinensis]
MSSSSTVPTSLGESPSKSTFRPLGSGSSGERSLEQLQSVAEIEVEMMKQESRLAHLHTQVPEDAFPWTAAGDILLRGCCVASILLCIKTNTLTSTQQLFLYSYDGTLEPGGGAGGGAGT